MGLCRNVGRNGVDFRTSFKLISGVDLLGCNDGRMEDLTANRVERGALTVLGV